MKEPCYRHELKYLLSPEKAEILFKRLEKFLPRDPHVRGKGYTIRSLYFDSFNDEALQDNLMGAALREKFRIRLYEEDFTLIRLERKISTLWILRVRLCSPSWLPSHNKKVSHSAKM